MLTTAQMTECVRAISLALGAYTTPECAQERARNLVTALMFHGHGVQRADNERNAIVAGVLLTRGWEIRQFWDAVVDAETAFRLALLPSNGERFAFLVQLRMAPEVASKRLQDLGFTVPEGVLCA